MPCSVVPQGTATVLYSLVTSNPVKRIKYNPVVPGEGVLTKAQMGNAEHQSQNEISLNSGYK